MLHFLAHILGIDTQSSYFYAAYSGFIPSLLVFAACITWLRHKNCHQPGCWRLGHPHEHNVYCRKHKP